MRAAAMLLVLVMVTMIAVGGTFAKYTTKGTYKDNARIAYWGFASYVDGDENVSPDYIKFNLFDPAYTSDNGETVKSFNGDDVYAPGTKGECAVDFYYTDAVNDYPFGTGELPSAPEVAYNFTFDVEFTPSALDAEGHMEYTLKYIGADGTQKTETFAKAEDYVKAIASLAGVEATVTKENGVIKATATKMYMPGELPEFLQNNKYVLSNADRAANSLTLGWEYLFENPDGSTAEWDGVDNDYGNVPGWSGFGWDEMGIVLYITATQVD